MVEKIFKLKEAGTTVRTEVVAGITTFMTMAYIIFVQPAVLSATGMDPGAVMVATCLASAIGIFLMAFLANYPIAMAPAMGHNFFFAYTVCLGMGIPWQVVLGATFISGVIFIVTSLFAFREKIIDAVPDSLKNAIAVGIGLLIAFIGFEWSGIIVSRQGTLIGLGNLKSSPVILSFIGLAIISILLALRVRGAMLFGLIATTIIGMPFGIVQYKGLLSKPPSLAPTLFKLDIAGALREHLFAVIFILFFLDLFDTVGTLIGIGQQGGFMKKGRLPKAKQALLSDAIATVNGSMLGTSTITSYIESAAGVSAGGRTGLANIVTGLLFILAIFFYPLAEMIGGKYQVPGSIELHPVIAPALILIGCFMLKNVIRIDWDDYTEAVPAFLTIMVMPLTFSIMEGIAFGFIAYSTLKLLTGKRREVHLILYIFSVLFLIRYIFMSY
ncbi:MAG: guanine permease [Omnitrophica WOR_2 bacterium SM23_29]|nr:MAG: guanine permease [Omnitrophica WOR_2 bacterium SM23_29]